MFLNVIEILLVKSNNKRVGGFYAFYYKTIIFFLKFFVFLLGILIEFIYLNIFRNIAQLFFLLFKRRGDMQHGFYYGCMYCPTHFATLTEKLDHEKKCKM